MGSEDSLQKWLADLVLQGSPNANDELLKYVSPIDITCVSRRAKRLERVRLKKYPGASKTAKIKRGKQSKLIGALFEHLVKALLKNSQVLRYKQNLRTTTSEVDFLLQVEPLGSQLVPMLQQAGSRLVGEAKCYASAPKTEWVNEFRGILSTHGANTGILFVASPSSPLRSDIRQSIALHAAQKFLVVPFGNTQLNRVLSGESFIRVLMDQCDLSATHSSALSI